MICKKYINNFEILKFLFVIISLSISACSYFGAEYQDIDRVRELLRQGEESQEKLQIEANFDSLQRFIFKPKCSGCHNPDSEDKDAREYPMQTYSHITFYVVPGDPENSDLYILVQPDHKKRMPPRKSSLEELSQIERDKIYEWIKKGALEKSNPHLESDPSISFDLD